MRSYFKIKKDILQRIKQKFTIQQMVVYQQKNRRFIKTVFW